MLTMIDLGISNLQSVSEAFRRIGAPVEVADRPGSGPVILPGVGAFGPAMQRLRERGLVEALRGRPVLGICLGMQLLADESEELGLHRGLGLIRGRVVRLTGDRVPNIGWCDVDGIGGGRSFYFAHSYHFECDAAAGTIQYGGRRITAAVRQGQIFGVQFHPEKSQDAGLDVLAAIVKELG